MPRRCERQEERRVAPGGSESRSTLYKACGVACAACALPGLLSAAAAPAPYWLLTLLYITRTALCAKNFCEHVSQSVKPCCRPALHPLLAAPPLPPR